MKTSQLLKNVLLIAMFAILLTPLVSENTYAAFAIFAVLLVAGVITYMVRRQNGTVALEGLAAEVWIPLVKENFYPSNSFLTAATDMSDLVDNDKINFAEAGADPAVMKNNTVYPIGSNDASDLGLEIALDTYDTDSTIVRNAVAIELKYDQRALYAGKHRKALLKRLGLDAAYAYAPTAADADKFNTILNLGNGDSIIDAIIDLQAAYNLADEDGSDRNLVLGPSHQAKLAKEDKVLYKAIMSEPGSVLYGFKMWSYSKTPNYIGATGVKAAFGAAFVPGTHKASSIAFLGSEVMKAQGTVKLFSLLNDPNNKGDVFNFQMRGLVSSLRGKYACAILQ